MKHHNTICEIRQVILAAILEITYDLFVEPCDFYCFLPHGRVASGLTKA